MIYSQKGGVLVEEKQVTEELEKVEMDPEDIENNKAMGIIAYFIFFIPLLAAKDSPFAKYHANQGLTLLLTLIAINVVGSFIPIIGWMLIIPFGSLLILVLAIIGIMNAANGKAEPLPIIGKYTLIK